VEDEVVARLVEKTSGAPSSERTILGLQEAGYLVGIVGRRGGRMAF